MTSPNSTTQRLAVAAKKADRERDAQQAMRDYQVEQQRIDANTARLRALRLAKEAADSAAAVDETAPAKKRAARVRPSA